MQIVVNQQSEKPIYEQIYEQISSQILQGILPQGSMLPSIRSIAKELRISIITVNSAWEKLEQNGFIYTQAGKGCFVNCHEENELVEKKNLLASNRLKKELTYYKNLGIEKKEFIELIKKLY